MDKKYLWPLGFSATGLNAKLSYKKSRKDLAMFVSHLPANGAAVFTNSRVKAAPIIVTQQHLLESRGKVRAILVNSGSANAATGQQGIRNAKQSGKWVSEKLNIPVNQVWLASTGVIGPQIRLQKFKRGIGKITARINTKNVAEGHTAAEAIMTTDTHSKEAEVLFEIDGVPVRLWGCAKGSGMIHPDLRGPRGVLHATMLSFILTDAAVSSSVLQHALESVADKTFNCVSIDGDTSTNDFVGVMANGASGSPLIKHARGKNYKTLHSALLEVCDRLTNQIAMDGEGASRMIQIFVEKARTEKSARQMASVIASSPLVKTACHGADPNWGRVLMAMGRSGVPFDLRKVKIWIGDTLVCDKGAEINFSEAKVTEYMRGKRIIIRIHLGLGNKWSRYKTCDFTGQYVGINAGYRT